MNLTKEQKDKINNVKKEVDIKIKKYPYHTIAIATGVGIIMGILITAIAINMEEKNDK